MNTMADIVAKHINVYDDCKDETNVAVCECGHETPFSGPYDPDAGNRAHAQHVAAELAAAGYGNMADAWDAGYTTGNAHNGRRDANPYRGVGHE